MILRTTLCALAILSLAACGAKQAVASPCEHRVFEGEGFVVCSFDAQTQKLRLAWKSIAGTPYRSFAALSHELDEGKLAFAMNAGMYDQAGSPIGLYIEQGRELKYISTMAGPGNFHMKPNGVFWIDADSDPHVSATDDYIAAAPQPAWATQSGPMLVIGGQLHPDFQSDGASRYVRNGVGVSGRHAALFVISDRPVSFGKLARLFRDELHCDDALYLDGAVSSLWAPSLGRSDSGNPLGPLVVVTFP
jgi:uncharacterized protein YigE (DUF2233 family)